MGADAVVLYLHDWRRVDRAIRNIASWLAAHDWNGDVILELQPIPGPAYAKRRELGTCGDILHQIHSAVHGNPAR